MFEVSNKLVSSSSSFSVFFFFFQVLVIFFFSKFYPIEEPKASKQQMSFYKKIKINKAKSKNDYCCFLYFPITSILVIRGVNDLVWSGFWDFLGQNRC